MSVRSLARSERGQASGASGAGRLLDGYDALTAALASALHGPLVDLRYRMVAREIRWEPGRAAVSVESPEGAPAGSISASAAIVAVPLGVVQAPDGPAGMRVTPTPDAWTNAMRVLRMGSVLRLVLHFRRAPWPRDLVLPPRAGLPNPDLVDSGAGPGTDHHRLGRRSVGRGAAPPRSPGAGGRRARRARARHRHCPPGAAAAC